MLLWYASVRLSKPEGGKAVNRKQEEMQRESAHLQDTLALVNRSLMECFQKYEGHAGMIQELQEGDPEHSSPDTGGLYSAQGFLDLLELSQSAASLEQEFSALQKTRQTINRLKRMKNAPYFARIDFRFADGKTLPVYIGRSSLMAQSALKIHVYDWRAPISSVFYQCTVGPAQYNAPAGMVQGELLLKRQYEIHHGALVYYFDADEQILDGFLRNLLSGPASTHMKGIVETIQRDQDRIIRDLSTDLLMVQGTAGSGKTSVALHRVAYLMYQELQDKRLSHSDILIIAPTSAFERYISQVLPDLGESQVQTRLFDGLLEDLLPDAPIQPRSAWVETWLSEECPARKSLLQKSMAFKGSRQYLALLDRFIAELPRRWIPFRDVDYDGICIEKRELMRTALCNSKRKAPFGIQLHMLEKSIWDAIRGNRPKRYAKLLAAAECFPQHAGEVQAFARALSIRESGVLNRHIRSFTRVDCRALYLALFTDKNSFLRLTVGLLPPQEAEALRVETLREMDAPALPYQDAIGVAYLQARLYGCGAFRGIRQVVVDEAQDLDAMHATLLHTLYPRAHFTLLGDIHQTLTASGERDFYSEMEAVLRPKSSQVMVLDKSFRCTREIWAYASRFLPPDCRGSCIARSGGAPQVHTAPSEEALLASIACRAKDCLDGGSKTIALLCKTAREARLLHQKLHEKLPLALMVGEEAALAPGICVTSLYTAKGLEFDAVFLCNVDAEHYHSKADQRLLYVACTRALHRLELFYTGEKSPLLPKKEEA